MNYSNFARPESAISATINRMEELMEENRCEECGTSCHERFCSGACEAEAQMDTVLQFAEDEDDLPDFDPGEYDPRDDEGDGYGDSGWQDDGRYDE